MKLTDGVNLHIIPSRKFKTQRIRLRFSAPLDPERLAGRVLIANMLEVANKAYPTARDFRQKLASLYGTSFSTAVGKKGAVHFLDIDLSFPAPDYLGGQDLTEELLNFLQACLFHPLTQADSFDDSLFYLEQKNLRHYLETEIEDSFYQADQAISQLFYQEERLKLPRMGTLELLEKETPQTVFRTFQKLLAQDQIDIFCLGDFDEARLVQLWEAFAWTPRQPNLAFEVWQPFSKITREQIEKKPVSQSVLELAYHLPAVYGEPDYFALLVLNGLLGGFAHSKLFLAIREEKGLAYTIGSQFDSLTACLKVYAGIDKKERRTVMKLIHQQWLALKNGQFSAEELAQTKQLLRKEALAAQDRQVTALEEAYHQQIFGSRSFNLDSYLTALDKVGKEAVMAIAAKARLQALYFMEGTV